MSSSSFPHTMGNYPPTPRCLMPGGNAAANKGASLRLIYIKHESAFICAQTNRPRWYNQYTCTCSRTSLRRWPTFPLSRWHARAGDRAASAICRNRLFPASFVVCFGHSLGRACHADLSPSPQPTAAPPHLNPLIVVMSLAWSLPKLHRCTSVKCGISLACALLLNRAAGCSLLLECDDGGLVRTTHTDDDVAHNKCHLPPQVILTLIFRISAAAAILWGRLKAWSSTSPYPPSAVRPPPA